MVNLDSPFFKTLKAVSRVIGKSLSYIVIRIVIFIVTKIITVENQPKFKK
jgi:hypothetical protein